MIAVLGGLADVERDLIRTLTAEGRNRAQKRGQHMGRPYKLTPEQRREALERKANGETNTDIGRSYNVSHMTIARLRAITPEVTVNYPLPFRDPEHRELYYSGLQLAMGGEI